MATLDYTNLWTVSATVLLAALIPCIITCIKAKPEDCVVAMEMASIVSVLILILFAKGFHRPSFTDLALTLAIMSLPGTLLYLYYLERWR